LETAKSTYKDRQRKREVEQMGETLEAYEQAVLAEGRAEGEARGRLEARREALRESLTERFGEVPPEILEKIDAVNDIERLKTAFRQAFHIDSLNDLEI
jgi:hypothetical protein